MEPETSNIEPSYYRITDTMQVIDFIENAELGYSLGNVVKYISRYRQKGGVEDLKKARWYLDRKIQQMGG